jgi:hypothetical protein
MPTNKRLGWKGSEGTNTLAYYENSYLAAVKSFITLGTDWKGLPGTNSLAYYEDL